MVVFIDESQDRERFVLEAIVADEVVSLNATVGRFRTISRHLKVDVREYHEFDLHRDHPRVLTRVLEEMSLWKRKKRRSVPRKDIRVVATYYLKAPSEGRGTALAHNRMLTVYRETFRSLVWALPLTPQDTVDVVCDRFEGCTTLEPTLEAILLTRAAGTVRFADSVLEKPLQLADLTTGTIRRHLAGDPNEDRFRFIAPLLYHLGVVAVRQ
ncbi:DUF3800 domain-containing protein [Sulfobacillus harzensis]|uniref:DUF3800 domain-containing protein n=1 Tax=Sulfobacillus harzensis TaxID=2729629 RepID=A0A7Y0Q4W9_9FIRM|nr:DUF3800 domain-containing protein [Sulfobacillus harzensis]